MRIWEEKRGGVRTEGSGVLSLIVDSTDALLGREGE